MPVGLQLVGNYLTESTLLHTAHTFQQTTDWHRRSPSLTPSGAAA
jgi:aspartyl-tRNA(Asn)/glutamyl-tRNA(Gln) amidotransferase subunit A